MKLAFAGRIDDPDLEREIREKWQQWYYTVPGVFTIEESVEK